MPSDLLPLNPACLLALYFSICHTCCYGVSLSAVPAGVVPQYRPYFLVWCLTISRACCVMPHYRPCLLVWCLIISHACWYAASLQDMPSGVVSHCRPCHLVWCLATGHACWCDTSLSAMPVSVVPHYRPCLLV